MNCKYPNERIEKLCKLVLCFHNVSKVSYFPMIIPIWIRFSFSYLSLSEGGAMPMEKLSRNFLKTFYIDSNKKRWKKNVGQSIGFISYSEAGLTGHVLLYIMFFTSSLLLYHFCILVFDHTFHPALTTLTSWYWLQFTEINYYPSITTLPLTPRILISTSSKEEHLGMHGNNLPTNACIKSVHQTIYMYHYILT